MFQKGNEYIRKDLHEKYGGNYVRRVTKSSKEPIIFIFSSSSEDYSFGENNHLYTCVGNKKMGKTSLWDHQVNGKKIYLFEKVNKPGGYWKFIDQVYFILNKEEKLYFFKNFFPKYEKFTKNIDSSFEHKKEIRELWNHQASLSRIYGDEELIPTTIDTETNHNPFSRSNGLLLPKTLSYLYKQNLITFQGSYHLELGIQGVMDFHPKIGCLLEELGFTKNLRVKEIVGGSPMGNYLGNHYHRFLREHIVPNLGRS